MAKARELASQAIADWTAAVALEPDCGDAHYNLARALSRDGRRREALRHWTKYLALDHASAWASRARQERKEAPEVRTTADRLAEDRVSAYADFFCLAQRFRCAAAIFSRASAERVRFFLMILLCEADAEGRPLRFAPDKPAKAFRAS
jgi:tetratricopeptide (TPR) repeat protein